MSSQILTGSFINVASTPKFVPIKSQISEFRLWNLTMSGVTSQGVAGSLTSDRIVYGEFNPNLMTSGTALIKQNGTVAGILAPLQNGYAAINGFTLFDSSVYSQGATFSILSFATGSTTVFTTSTNHGFKVGDTVRIWGLTSAPQMGGLLMTVTATNGTNTFTTLFNSTNAVTSVGSVAKVGNFAVQNSSLYYPQVRAIAAISLANPMVVTTLVQQNYQVGDVVRFQIPTVFGMRQLNSTTNGLPVQATVSAVNNAVGTQTVTFANVDSSAFTAFAWPAAANYPLSLPVMIPQGEGNTNQLSGVTPSPLPYANQDILGFATQNTGDRGILIGAGDGTNSATTGGLIGAAVDAWMWEAVTASQSYY
jgi:hypothetical protein